MKTWKWLLLCLAVCVLGVAVGAHYGYKEGYTVASADWYRMIYGPINPEEAARERRRALQKQARETPPQPPF